MYRTSRASDLWTTTRPVYSRSHCPRRAPYHPCVTVTEPTHRAPTGPTPGADLPSQYVPAQVEGEDVAEAAHARLPCEMEDTVEVGEVELVLGEIEAANLRVEPACVFLLQRRVVVVGEAVDADDVVPVPEQCFREVRADEAGCARYDVSQRLLTIPYSFAYPTR